MAQPGKPVKRGCVAGPGRRGKNGGMKRLLAIAALALVTPAVAQTPSATTNGSVTIATGNTFQTIIAALGAPPAQRRSITIENNNVNGDNCWLYVGAGGATTANSMLLGTGGSYQRYYPYVPS